MGGGGEEGEREGEREGEGEKRERDYEKIANNRQLKRTTVAQGLRNIKQICSLGSGVGAVGQPT